MIKNRILKSVFGGKLIVFEDSCLWSLGNIRKNDYKLYLADVKEKINIYIDNAEYINHYIFTNYDNTENLFIIFNKKQNDTNKTKEA